jgi:hypothetical protein
VPLFRLPGRAFAGALIAFLACIVLAAPAHADRRTVCTITVNSDDEREVLRRTLPPADYDFVELVERGRSDWLRGACEKRVRCDVLLISGHFDGGTEFYTDRLDDRESLPVEEMERVACSESCPGLFTQLKEVYLMGCNTLSPQPMRTAPGEVLRSLATFASVAGDAQRAADALTERYGESNRDRMRQIFKDVPVIYGFPGKAPLGRYAGPILERYLRSGGEFGEGRASARLLSAFAAGGMTATSGMTDADPRAGFRADACRFVDDRVAPERKAAHLHDVLRRGAAEVRMFFDHIERHASRMPAADESAEMAQIAGDAVAKSRFVAIARDADDPPPACAWRGSRHASAGSMRRRNAPSWSTSLRVASARLHSARRTSTSRARSTATVPSTGRSARFPHAAPAAPRRTPSSPVSAAGTAATACCARLRAATRRARPSPMRTCRTGRWPTYRSFAW